MEPLHLTLGGNATVLIELGPVTIVTDPWLSDQLGPWKRMRPCALATEQVASARVLLVSHAHPDHLDPRSLAIVPRETTLLAPAGVPARRLAALGFRRLHALVAWERWEGEGVRIVAVPAVHTRGSLGYVVERGGRTLYFAGDAGPRTPFHEIGKRCGPLEVALLPVGGSSLAIGPLQRHLTPRAAAWAASVLRPRWAVPIHWGHVPCVPRVLDRFRGQPERFAAWLERIAPEVRLLATAEGERVAVEIAAEAPSSSVPGR